MSPLAGIWPHHLLQLWCNERWDVSTPCYHLSYPVCTIVGDVGSTHAAVWFLTCLGRGCNLIVSTSRANPVAPSVTSPQTSVPRCSNKAVRHSAITAKRAS